MEWEAGYRPMNPEIDIEFGTLAVGTWFVIDSNGTTFEKTSDREARIVVGNIKLLGIPSQFGLRKPVRVVPRDGAPLWKR
jgi:hypothetical protein